MVGGVNTFNLHQKTRKLSLPVWAYDTDTLHILMWAETTDKHLPRERGIISRNKAAFGIFECRGTCQIRSVGPRKAAVETSWTIATVTGWGKSVKIFLPTTLFVELIENHTTQSDTTRITTVCRLWSLRWLYVAMFVDYRHVTWPWLFPLPVKVIYFM